MSAQQTAFEIGMTVFYVLWIVGFILAITGLVYSFPHPDMVGYTIANIVALFIPIVGIVSGPLSISLALKRHGVQGNTNNIKIISRVPESMTTSSTMSYPMMSPHPTNRPGPAAIYTYIPSDEEY